jgi:hypothetical protein
MTAFTYKGYGRIYTDPEHIQDVESILREIDENEYDHYYPGFLVASWGDYPNVEYIDKFALHGYSFKERCRERNIPVFVFDAGENINPLGYTYTKFLSKEEIQQRSYGELK